MGKMEIKKEKVKDKKRYMTTIAFSYISFLPVCFRSFLYALLNTCRKVTLYDSYIISSISWEHYVPHLLLQ